MPQVGILFAGVEYCWAEARKAAEEPTFPYPPPLIEAMADQRNDEHPSASSIVGCLRRFELQRTTDYYGEASGELPMLFGTAFHTMMEGYRKPILKPGEFGEMRLSTNINLFRDDTSGPDVTVPFSGQPDFFSPGKLISDWKTKGYIPQGFTPPQEHIGQVNIYNWLALENGLEPAPMWELAYVSQSWAARFQDATEDPRAVGAAVRRRLIKWHGHSTNGTLPPPVPQLFQPDAKGKLPAPCGYCPVREQCLARLRADTADPF